MSILVLQSFAEGEKAVYLLLMSYRFIVTINVLWLLLTVPWVGLQYEIVVFPDHTHLLFVVTCWEKADLLTLFYVMFSCVVVTSSFSYGFLGQVWYLVLSIPDLYLLCSFYCTALSHNTKNNNKKKKKKHANFKKIKINR